jgi:hypothetical protein
MRDDLRDLRRLHAVVEREGQVVRQFDGLVAGDQRGDGDDAAVARGKARPFPEVVDDELLRV